MTDAERLSAAILLWLPVIDGRFHLRGAEALVAAYGTEVAVDLAPEVGDLVEEFNASDAFLRTSDLAEMGDLAIADFAVKRPQISAGALQRMANSYTFGHR